MLLWFVILYTAFAIISSGSLALPPELLETYALGRHPAAGYAGHAPLAPLIAGGWFTLFPPTDWAFHLLAMVNAAAGLFAADRIARQFLEGDKRIAVLLLLLLMPFYQFMGQGFGANETMLSTWPIATWCFLRAFATRDLAWSAGAGAAAALAVLGDYYSVFLIAAFAVAVLRIPGAGHSCDRGRRGWRWRWCRRACCPISCGWCITPAWQRRCLRPARRLRIRFGDFAPLHRRGGRHACGRGGLAVRPDRALRRDTLWPPDPDGRMLVVLLAVPLVLPLLATPFAGVALTQSWSTASAWFLLPVILLRPKAAVLTRTAAIRITALVAATTIGALAAAPLLAWRRHAEGTAEGREHYRPVSTEVTNAWRPATGQPLRVVTGDPRLASAVAFYSPDHPDAAPGDETERLADGFAACLPCRRPELRRRSEAAAAGKPNVQFITLLDIKSLPWQIRPAWSVSFLILAPPGSKPAKFNLGRRCRPLRGGALE